MKEEKVGEYIVNSRIFIKYPEAGKPTIDFEYPDNENQVKDLRKSIFILFPASILAFLLVALLVFLAFPLVPPHYPTNCQGLLTQNLTTHEVKQFELFCDNGYFNFTYTQKDFSYGWQRQLTMKEGIWESGYLFGLMIVVVGLWYGFTLLFTFPISMMIRKTKWGEDGFPEWNKKLRKKDWQAMFTECPDNLQIEIPLFKNVYLDYIAEEEFADYLTEVNITEHDIKYIEKKRRKINLKPNVMLWKAVFKFKKKPTKGFLKVEFT